MKKALIAIFLCAMAALSARGQVINNPLTANITAQSTDCSVANSCAWQFITFSAGNSVVTLAGTFSGTFLVEQTNNGTTWTTAATLSSAGVTTYSSNGFTAVRVRCSTYVSGTAVVTLSTGAGGGGGGGGLPSGLTYVAPTLTVSTTGTGNGQLALSGNTSGVATFTAPAIAGTTTNGVTMSNVLSAPSGAATTPSYAFTSNAGTGMWLNSTNLAFSNNGSLLAQISGTGFVVSVPGGIVLSPTFGTSTNCSQNTASPAACGSSAAGSFVVPTTTTTYQVNSTAVKAASRIFLFPHTDTRDLPGTPTCVAPAITSEPVVSATSTGASFTITIASTTGQTCWDYWIVN